MCAAAVTVGLAFQPFIFRCLMDSSLCLQNICRAAGVSKTVFFLRNACFTHKKCFECFCIFRTFPHFFVAVILFLLFVLCRRGCQRPLAGATSAHPSYLRCIRPRLPRGVATADRQGSSFVYIYMNFFIFFGETRAELMPKKTVECFSLKCEINKQPNWPCFSFGCAVISMHYVSWQGCGHDVAVAVFCRGSLLTFFFPFSVIALFIFRGRREQKRSWGDDCRGVGCILGTRRCAAHLGRCRCSCCSCRF